MKQRLKELAVGLGFGLPGVILAAIVRDQVPGWQGTVLGMTLLLACIIGGYLCLDWIGGGRRH